MGLRVGFVAALLACAFAFLGSASASHPPPPQGGKALGIIHRGAGGASGLRAARMLGRDGSPVDPTLSLTNHGSVLMHTQKVYLIFWAPSGYSFPAGYESGTEQFAQDLAHDSGKTSNAYGAIQQYGVSNVFAYGGSIDDMQPFPASGCPTGGGSVCLTDFQVLSEIARLQQANAWSGGYVNQFALILPPNVDTCFDGTGADCSYTDFCAYHSWYSYNNAPSVPYVYLNMPYEVPSASGCHTSDGSTVEPEPNGGVDVLLSPLAHEEREAATDPTQHGWYDANGNEADDKCYIHWGPSIGQTGGSVDYNQLINGNAYETQTEWSNALHGCYQVGPPTVASLSTTHALPGDMIGVTGTNFFSSFGTSPTVKFNGVTSPSVSVDSPTHLTAEVPAGVHTGKVSIVALGGTATGTQMFGPQPDITSLSDDHDVTGTSITVNGDGFFGVTSVKFNGLAASFSSVATDGTSLHAIVPAAATTGPVTVTTLAGGASAGSTFTVKPKITSFTPVSAKGGSLLTIAGTGLAGTTTVSFQGHSGVAVTGTPTATSAKVIVPMDATTGAITTDNGTDTSLPSVASFKPLPVITSFTPTDGAVGSTNVQINGGELADATVVKFGTFTASIDPPSATQITATVPASFSSGKITVITPEGTAVSTQTFFVTKVTSVTPAMAKAGATITITGQGLASATSVDFVNHAAVPVFGTPTATTVKVVVPNDAVAGPLMVNTPRATPTTPNFKPLPSISSLSIVDGGFGDTVHVTGTNLIGASSAKFGAYTAPAPTSVTATGLDVLVPNAPFSSGAVSIVTPAGTAISTQIFQVTKVTGLTPLLAPAGATVTITGQGLSDAQTVDFGNHTGVVPTSPTPTSIKVVVPPNATDGTLVVHMPDGMTLTTLATFKPLPRITSVDHATYQAGDTVTVTGTNFQLTSGSPTAKLGAVAVTPTSITPTSFQFVVPDNGLTGAVTYSDAAGVTTSSANIVHVVPKIDALTGSNDHGKTGDHITLTGKSFTGTSSVKFGADTHAAAFTLAAGGTSLTATVPTTAASGPIHVTNAGGTTDSADFTVTPVITSFTPGSAAAGATITVNGSGFAGADHVTFNGGTGTVTSPASTVTPTSLTTVVPDGVGSGPITVHTSSGGVSVDSAASGANFNPTASLTSFSPAGGVPGTSDIVLSGFGFTGATAVSFNGTSAAFTVNNDDQITVTAVPVGATTGKITVSRPGSPATLTSATNFVVPTITGLGSATAQPHDTLEIDGAGLHGSTLVTFTGGATAVPSDVTGGIHVAVPDGAHTGTVTVTTSSYGDVTSTDSLTIQFTLTISVSGSGTVTSDVGGINCHNGTGTCSAVVDDNTAVQLTATADGGGAFVNWTGGPMDGSPDNPFLFGVTGDISTKANFNP